MGELVSAISYLCKLLDCLVHVSLKPDFYRLSKLNKLNSEQIKQFWNLLHKLCCFSTSISCQNNSYKCMESYMRKIGGAASYFLHPDATSRQLLLTLGFLLSEGIVEINIDKVLIETPLGEELPTFMLKPSTSDDSETSISPEMNAANALLNYALFLCGKIKHNLRAIANFSQEKAQLYAKIHKSTVGVCGLKHLSSGDLLMLARPDLQTDFLTRCQPCVPLLQAYSKWHRKKHVFWKWMDLVLEEESKETNKTPSVADITHLHEFLRRLKSDVQRPEVAEDEKSSKNDSSLTTSTIRRLCLSENGDVLDSLIEQMDLEINNLLVNNENKKESIQIKLLEEGNQFSDINQILETFCCSGAQNKEILDKSDIELPLAAKLQALSTDEGESDLV